MSSPCPGPDVGRWRNHHPPLVVAALARLDEEQLGLPFENGTVAAGERFQDVPRGNEISNICQCCFYRIGPEIMCTVFGEIWLKYAGTGAKIVFWRKF